MSTCPCSSDVLVRVTFGNGTALLRCPAHETQRWLVDGRPVGSAAALAELRELFSRRRDSGSRRAASPRRVVQLPVAPGTEATRMGAHAGVRVAASRHVEARDVRVDDAALTALLRARGLSGSWAVA